MKLPSAELLLVLLLGAKAVAASTNTLPGFAGMTSGAGNPAASSSPGGGTATAPIRRLVLDPLQVITIPVALDRVTTLRFPSPVSDLVSALVATEPHPQAHFQLTFQPGEPFFSVRALKPQAATTLNVVWKSQTYVLQLQEASEPCLSVIFDEPSPANPNPPARAAVSSPRSPAKPATKYLELARQLDFLKQEFPFTLSNVDRVMADSRRTVDSIEIRLTEVVHHKGDRIGVARVVLANPDGGPVDWGSNGLAVQLNGQLLPILGSDFDGVVPVLSERFALVVFQFPPVGTIQDPTDIQIVVPSQETVPIAVRRPRRPLK
jgi:hypothetical protein